MANFTIPLQELADKVKADLDAVVRKSTLDMFNAIALKSPVDTGRFRANMNVSYNAIDKTVTQSTDQGRINSEIAKVTTLPVGGVVYICNSLPYATVLEFGLYPNPPKNPTGKTTNGYSTQAPQGMFRITAMEYSAYVKKVLGK